MKLEEFNYHLPDELIAQEPCVKRGFSRMMLVNREDNSIEESMFYHLPQFLKQGDVVIINDTKVIPACLIGYKETGGTIELLLLSKKNETKISQTWEVLLRPAKRVRVGSIIGFDGTCEGKILERISDKKWMIEFTFDMTFDNFLSQYGRAPLPPYIKRSRIKGKSVNDIERYQTIYAKIPGSIAAPTAGLHFSQHILDLLKENGVQVVSITLHIGYGTFLPIETDVVEQHSLEEEYCEIGSEAAEIINKAERVIAVGTTSTRAVESACDEQGRIKPTSAFTGLFIYPGYRFKRINALLTNFHLPMSSLFLLVYAFAGRGLIRKAYEQAMKSRFRFYSYGDCMLIL